MVFAYRLLFEFRYISVYFSIKSVFQFRLYLNITVIENLQHLQLLLKSCFVLILSSAS